MSAPSLRQIIATPKVAREAEQRAQGVCRTCLAPIWNEGGTIGRRQRDTGWSDRIERGGDSLVCFKAADYRHVPLTGREAEIYDLALALPGVDAARVLVDPNGGCSCEPFDQDAGGGYTEHLLEYEPDCPVHSTHLYDPRKGEWILDPREAVTDAYEAAPALADDCDCEDREALVRPEGLVCGTCGKVIDPSSEFRS